MLVAMKTVAAGGNCPMLVVMKEGGSRKKAGVKGFFRGGQQRKLF